MSQRKSSDVDAASALQHEDEAVLIDRVSSARRSGTDDQAAVDELLRRAAAENKAALDRLGR
jgi:microcompartment protein CcmK/EutM